MRSDIAGQISGLDHLVLTVRDLAETLAFYEIMLGMEAEQFKATDGSLRSALKFGTQKINLHVVGQEFEPKADVATPGSADLCFLSDLPLEAWIRHFAAKGAVVIDGPVPRTGANGPVISIYLRDPDENLIEISNSV